MKFYSKKWAIPEKIQVEGRGREGMEFLGLYIEEKACGNSRDKQKKKENFQGYLMKNGGISIGLGFWTWNFQGVSQQFCRISRDESLFSL